MSHDQQLYLGSDPEMQWTLDGGIQEHFHCMGYNEYAWALSPKRFSPTWHLGHPPWWVVYIKTFSHTFECSYLSLLIFSL